MATSFGALCNEFYVNQRLSLKMDLPEQRETLLHFFDRMRKAAPGMDRFRRFESELALESPRQATAYQWLALRRASVRSGFVNPDTMEQAYRFHRLVLDQAPHHLGISPLEVDYLELLFGFDLECEANHDQIIYDALIDGSPMAELLRLPGARVIDAQPILGCTLNEAGDLQASFEVCTRPRTRRGASSQFAEDPISVLVAVRQYGPLDDLAGLGRTFDVLAQQCEALASDKLVPQLLTPVARRITSSSAGGSSGG
jgi:hypothetical protein